jgi:hypothetical protein
MAILTLEYSVTCLTDGCMFGARKVTLQKEVEPGSTFHVPMEVPQSLVAAARGKHLQVPGTCATPDFRFGG